MGIEVRPPTSGGAAKVAGVINRLAGWLAQHWLAVFNALVAIFVGLPFLAPVLMHAGATGPARLIYTLYSPTCHQLPERSFFLFGPEVAPSVAALEQAHVLPAGLGILQRQALRLIGGAEVGYKVAICERDVAIYGAILLSGLVFGALRPRLRRANGLFAKLPLWVFGLLMVPIAVDGLTQLFGLRESNWLLRTITGGLFGAGAVWFSYPYIQEAMDDVVRSAQSEHRAQDGAANWTKAAG